MRAESSAHQPTNATTNTINAQREGKGELREEGVKVDVGPVVGKGKGREPLVRKGVYGVKISLGRGVRVASDGRWSE